MTSRRFMVYYRHKDGYAHEHSNHFTAVDPFDAATTALEMLARPCDFTALAVLDESNDSIHLYNIVTHKPILEAA